ncbi:MAG TPA: EAL domain-containing protein, partial [Gemmatimonadales bacterium]|nr:EAL domain-containing protein [Gemmatimonadales bacterium]
PDENPAELLQEAEIAMHRAKRSGSDRVEIFNVEMRSDPDGPVALEGELRAAIDRNQLRVVYQPVFYLPTETLAGFEVELRWEHPRLGTLNPAYFVPLAQESDLIAKLGSYVLTRAAREAQRWQRELPRPEQPVFVSASIGSHHLFRPELVNEIRHLLGRAVMPKGSLRLEISESLIMENPERARAMLDQLAAAGVGLSLDEFGTGYSSLSYLSQFAFDTIKVDRAFVQARGQNGDGGVMLRSVVALAKELGRKVAAEGVEVEDDIAFLRSIGCEYAQGQYYGELMADRDVGQLLKVVRRAERRMKRNRLFRQGARVRNEPAAPAQVALGAPPSPAALGAPAPHALAANGARPPAAPPTLPASAGAAPAPRQPPSPPATHLPGRAPVGARSTLLGPPPPLSPPPLPGSAVASKPGARAVRLGPPPAPPRSEAPLAAAPAGAPRQPSRPAAAPQVSQQQIAGAPPPMTAPGRTLPRPAAPRQPVPPAVGAPPRPAPSPPPAPPAAPAVSAPLPLPPPGSAPPRPAGEPSRASPATVGPRLPSAAAATPRPASPAPAPQASRNRRPAADLSKLPSSIRESLAKLAGDTASAEGAPAAPAQASDTTTRDR